MIIVEEIGEAALLDQLVTASEVLCRAALQLQELLVKEHSRQEDVTAARSMFLESATDVELRLRELDRAGITAFDIGTAKKRFFQWENQIRKEIADA